MKAKKIGILTLCSAILFGAALYGQTTVAATQLVDSDVAKLKAQLAEQQKQLDALKAAMEEQKKLIEKTANAVSTPDTFALPRNKALGDVASTTPILPPIAPVAPVVSSQAGNAVPESPLQIRIGDAYITPVGFMDFTDVWRNHDHGSGIGTNFGGTPYGNVFQNQLSENRLSIQNSRIGFRVDALVHDAHIIGYMEADFLGNNPSNVAVTSNSNTLRSRLYWVDLRKGNWELLGGQTWSLITPGRNGINPLPGNLFYSQDIDVNYQAGLVWGRIPELRLVGHFADDKVSFALAFDQGENYVGGSGGSGIVTAPSTLASSYIGGELNNGATTVSAPGLFADTIAKLAFDPNKSVHFEVGGLVRPFRVFNPTTSTHYSAAGGGAFVNSNFQLWPGFRLIENAYWSDGGGRYIFGLAPDAAITSNGDLSLIHSGSTVDGFEWTFHNTLIYAYYGGIYIQRNVQIDTTGKTPALVGWGYTGAPSNQNRIIQELTFGFNQTIWRDAKYGALNFMAQYSYDTRSPWYVPNNGSPDQSNLNQIYLNLRYTLPGSAPTLGAPAR
ncbi:MAG TPA: hypothetical protein VFW44_11015 [Bryobacteraceae bacterium]|nr:hypothetical protein [Bryobacteraceae bacterium]